MNQYSDNGQKPKKSIWGFVFLFFFFGCIIGAVAYSEIDKRMSIMFAGLIFLSIGIIASASSLKRPSAGSMFTLLFPLIGIFMTGVPIYLMYVEKHPEVKQINTEKLIITLMLSLFTIVGLGMLFGVPLMKKLQMKRCTEIVSAECIDVKVRISHSNGSSYHSSHRLYAPVWKFFYDGKEHVVAETTYTNINVAEIGQEAELYINPKDPSDYLRELPHQDIAALIIGLSFTIMSGIGFYFFLFK